MMNFFRSVSKHSGWDETFREMEKSFEQHCRGAFMNTHSLAVLTYICSSNHDQPY